MDPQAVPMRFWSSILEQYFWRMGMGLVLGANAGAVSKGTIGIGESRDGIVQYNASFELTLRTLVAANDIRALWRCSTRQIGISSSQ
jgi:hypothetical protein